MEEVERRKHEWIGFPDPDDPVCRRCQINQSAAEDEYCTVEGM